MSERRSFSLTPRSYLNFTLQNVFFRAMQSAAIFHSTIGEVVAQRSQK